MPSKCSARDNSAPKSKIWSQYRQNQRIMTKKNITFFHNLSYFCFGNRLFPVLLSVRALLTWSPKRNKCKVFSGSRVTLPVNFACKPGLSFNPLARVTLAVGLPYLLVNMALAMEPQLRTASPAVAIKDCDAALFPNISILLQIASTIPVTSCEFERSASTLRRLNNYMRASMGKDRLSHLALLHIHYTTPVDLDTVIDCHARSHPCQLRLENLLQ